RHALVLQERHVSEWIQRLVLRARRERDRDHLVLEAHLLALPGDPQAARAAGEVVDADHRLISSTDAISRARSCGRDSRWSPSRTRVKTTSSAFSALASSSAWVQGTSGSRPPCRIRTGAPIGTGPG